MVLLIMYSLFSQQQQVSGKQASYRLIPNIWHICFFQKNGSLAIKERNLEQNVIALY